MNTEGFNPLGRSLFVYGSHFISERQRRSTSGKGTDGQSEFVLCDPENPIKCGQEAACLFRDDIYRCVCPQDLSDAKPNRICSLKTGIDTNVNLKHSKNFNLF